MRQGEECGLVLADSGAQLICVDCNAVALQTIATACEGDLTGPKNVADVNVALQTARPPRVRTPAPMPTSSAARSSTSWVTETGNPSPATRCASPRASRKLHSAVMDVGPWALLDNQAMTGQPSRLERLPCVLARGWSLRLRWPRSFPALLGHGPMHVLPAIFSFSGETIVGAAEQAHVVGL